MVFKLFLNTTHRVLFITIHESAMNNFSSNFAVFSSVFTKCNGINLKIVLKYMPCVANTLLLSAKIARPAAPSLKTNRYGHGVPIIGYLLYCLRWKFLECFNRHPIFLLFSVLICSSRKRLYYVMIYIWDDERS